MSEPLQVTSALMRASREKEVRVLATVARTEGSTYRRIGARLVAFPDGSHVGSVSAGCMRSTVVQSPFVSWSHFQGQRNSDADSGHRLAHRSSTRANIHHLAHRSMKTDPKEDAAKHLPLIKRRMGRALKYHTIDKGLAGGRPNVPPPYVVMCHLLCESVEAYESSNSAVLLEETLLGR